MIVHVVEASYLSHYKIKLKFDDRESGVVDLSRQLKGEIFEPLKNVKYFKTFYLNPDAGTIMWDNGADFAPEFLHERLKKSRAHK